MWYVYILKSTKRKWYYVGSTNRLEQRIQEHNTGKVRSTKSFLPLELVYKCEYVSEILARGEERLLKNKRIAKEEIIRNIEGKIF